MKVVDIGTWDLELDELFETELTILSATAVSGVVLGAVVARSPLLGALGGGVGGVVLGVAGVVLYWSRRGLLTATVPAEVVSG